MRNATHEGHSNSGCPGRRDGTCRRRLPTGRTRSSSNPTTRRQTGANHAAGGSGRGRADGGPKTGRVAAAAPAAGVVTYESMTFCYPQLGAESDWRTANTASIKETATKLGVKQLIFSDAQQKQENQISAMRACIQQGVDVIGLPPVVEDGWDAVLTEAKNARIPVIIVDRTVSADKSLYASHIGSDMVLEGGRAAAEINKALPSGGKVLELSGTTGLARLSVERKVSATRSIRTSRFWIPRPATSPARKPSQSWKPS